MELTGSQTLRGVAQTLANLEIEERQLSDRRTRLHRQIDGVLAVYLGAPLGTGDRTLLDQLEDLERHISSERRGLHERIDRLRVKIGIAPGRPVSLVAA